MISIWFTLMLDGIRQQNSWCCGVLKGSVVKFKINFKMLWKANVTEYSDDKYRE